MSAVIESGFSSEEVLNVRFPLHRACRDGDVGALCSLIQCITNPADLSVEDTFYGWMPIHWAAHFGKLECVMRLVQVGSGVNAVTSRFAQTPIHIAAFGGHPDCLLWLLQAGADINRQDYVGEAPIHKAARAGSLECVNALLIQGAKADMRNASGLTAADLAHAQGFGECAEILSNAQNLQRNLAQSHSQTQPNGFCLNTAAQNGGHSHPVIQGRSFLNGAPNRKRSFDSMDSSQIKKARTDGLGMPPGMLNGSGPHGGAGDVHMESMSVESAATQCSELGHIPHSPYPLCSMMSPGREQTCSYFPNYCRGTLSRDTEHVVAAEVPSNSHTQPRLPNGYDPTPEPAAPHYHHSVCRDAPENTVSTSTAGSQVEHQRSVKAEQFYDHALYSTMLLYHGS